MVSDTCAKTPAMGLAAQNRHAELEKSSEEVLHESSSSSQTLAERAKPVGTSPRSLHGIKWGIAYGLMISTTFLFALDNTIVAAIQPSILGSLGAVELLPWIGTAFSLGSACILPWGKAYDHFDIKWLFIMTVALFEIGSAICGAAPSMTALIIGRVIAGVGGSGMYVGGLNYITQMTSLKERSIYVSGVAVIWGIGSVLGPVVGGAFASSAATWRWAFYINLVIGAISAPAYFMLLPSIAPDQTKSFWERLRAIDWIATVVFLGGSASFTMAVSFSGTTYPWKSGQTIALWTVTGLLLIVTVLVTIWHPFSTRGARLVPGHFLKRPLLVNQWIQMFMNVGIMYASIYYVALFFAFTRGDGPMEAGIRLLPLICPLVVTSLLNGQIMPRTGLYIPWYFFGSMLMLIGTALMVTINSETTEARIYGYTILLGAGVGCFGAAGFPVMQASVDPKDVPNAVSFQALAQVLGGVVYLSTSGSIMFNTASKLLAPLLPPGTSPAFIHDLTAGVHGHAFQSLDQQTADAVIPEITTAIRNVFIFCLAGSALSFTLSMFLERKRLDLEPSAP